MCCRLIGVYAKLRDRCKNHQRPQCVLRLHRHVKEQSECPTLAAANPSACVVRPAPRLGNVPDFDILRHNRNCIRGGFTKTKGNRDLTRRCSLRYGLLMTCLGAFPWWPTAWVPEKSASVAPTDISKDAVLTNARRVPGGLTLVADQNGVIYTATVGSHQSEDFLILLRHILLQHWGEPISAVEDFDVSFGDWK